MMTKAFCGVCGEDLSETTDLSLPEQSPCPRCGSRTRKVHIAVEDTLSVSLTEYMCATGRKEGRIVAFRESERQGRRATADEKDDGSLTFSLTGTSPQGEEDTLSTCRILVRALNAAGAAWGEPTEPDEAGVADCIAVNRVNCREQLSIQVVRAVVEGTMWAKLSRERSIHEIEVAKDDVIAFIKSSINKKASDRKIPNRIRPSIVLAIDATRLPAFALDSVAGRCKDVLGTWIRSLGFQSVWLVGPAVDLTWQLDAPS